MKKVFVEALNAVKVLGLLKKFGPAQNILGSVKGQGISSACIPVLQFDFDNYSVSLIELLNFCRAFIFNK